MLLLGSLAFGWGCYGTQDGGDGAPDDAGMDLRCEPPAQLPGPPTLPDGGGLPVSAGDCDCSPDDGPSGPEVASPLLSFDLREADCDCYRAGESASATAALTGPLTLVAEVRLDDRPTERAPLISRWTAPTEERAYEIGFDRSQYPYLLLSEDGRWSGATGHEIKGERQVRIAESYVVSATFVPETRIALHINGHAVREVTSNVPESLFGGQASLTVGARPSDGNLPPLGGALGRILLYDRALEDATLDAVACELGYSSPPPAFPPVRAITSGPRHHWFGYYDKHQVGPDGRYVLGNEVDFEGRAPEPDDEIAVGMVDLEDGDRWITLGHTTAWNWQQGCMLQWLPGSESEVVWNDREGSGDTAHYVTRILDLDTGTIRTLPRPIYTIASDGTTALGLDFRRLQHMRPGYGYAGIPDPNATELAPADSGIYRMDMETGESELIVSLAEVAAIPDPTRDFEDAMHYFNVLQINPSATRFLFVHRWRPDGGTGPFRTRKMAANMDGSDIRSIGDRIGMSHQTWRNDRHALIWTRGEGYSLYEDGVGFLRRVFKHRNGHQSYLPDMRWMVTDTYPDARGFQHPYLYNFQTDEIVALGRFYSPPAYRGRLRCDTHPRVSRDGTKIIIDSPHDEGRQMYMIDIAGILADRTVVP